MIRRRDLHDYPYTNAYLAYSRDPRVLSPYWQLALDGCVRPHLEVPGVPLLLHDLFVPRSEWGGTLVVASSSIPPTRPSPTPSTWWYSGDDAKTTGMRGFCQGRLARQLLADHLDRSVFRSDPASDLRSHLPPTLSHSSEVSLRQAGQTVDCQGVHRRFPWMFVDGPCAMSTNQTPVSTQNATERNR